MGCVCMRESMSKPAILAQASQARLGEIGRDAYPLSARGHRSGGGFWSLGEGSSRLVRLAQAIPSRLFLWDSSPRRGIFLLGEREYVGCSGAGGLHRILLDGIQSFASVCFPLMAVFFINKGKPTSVVTYLRSPKLVRNQSEPSLNTINLLSAAFSLTLYEIQSVERRLGELFRRYRDGGASSSGIQSHSVLSITR
ncbi:hypothetical protein DEO72_LG3g998 [Vigna unguiculata]|uniref:Uncharacterized protein n=1 Tax=Vigna unguiculata TaxID=3917 RepID=A0A4D6LDR4_VIGUN|nr:hypothetical protein DEO72_LG3g998 [Vigna unguiculata]